MLIITTGADTALCTNGSVDQLIQQVLDLKKNPVLVLGPEGDEVLLHSRLAEHCDLAFDPNFSGNIFSSLNAGLHATTGPVLAMTLKRFAESRSSEGKNATCATSAPSIAVGTQEESKLWTSLEAETLAASRAPKNDEPTPADVILVGWPADFNSYQTPESGKDPQFPANDGTQSVTRNINSSTSFGSAFPLGVSASGALKLKSLPASTAFSPSSEICFSVIQPTESSAMFSVASSVVPGEATSGSSSTPPTNSEMSCPLLHRASHPRSA